MNGRGLRATSPWTPCGREGHSKGAGGHAGDCWSWVFRLASALWLVLGSLGISFRLTRTSMAATDGLGPDSSSWQKASFTRSSSAPPDANWLMSNPALHDTR